MCVCIHFHVEYIVRTEKGGKSFRFLVMILEENSDWEEVLSSWIWKKTHTVFQFSLDSVSVSQSIKSSLYVRVT